MIYLLHFHSPYKHARHYLGYSHNRKTLSGRLWYHRHGQGAKLTKAVVESGGGWEVVRLWEGDQTFERQLHNFKNNRLLCPKCNPQAWERRYTQNQIDIGELSHGY